MSTQSIRSACGAITIGACRAAPYRQAACARRRPAGTGRRSARRGRPQGGGCRVPPPSPWHDAVMARTPLEDLLIVDADVHVHESPRAHPLCDPPWNVALEAVEDVPERYLDIPGFSPGGDGTADRALPHHARGGADGALARADGRRAQRDPRRPRRALPRPPAEDRRAPADRLRRRRSPAPTTPGCARNGRPSTARSCTRSSPARRTRRTRRGRSRSTPTMPSPSTCRAPAWTPCGATGAMTRSTTRRRTPACPALLHAVTVTSPVFPFNNHGFDTEFARHSTSHTFSIMSNVISMVSTGVVVRFPELRIRRHQAGISWMPFVCNRLDKEFLERRREVPFLTERPSHYVKRSTWPRSRSRSRAAEGHRQAHGGASTTATTRRSTTGRITTSTTR